MQNLNKIDSSRAGENGRNATRFAVPADPSALGIMRNLQPPSNGAASSGFPLTSKNKLSGPVYWLPTDEGFGVVEPCIQEGMELRKIPDPRETRLERFALQSVSRRLLWGSRTAKCLRLRRQGASSVEVWRSADHGSTHFGALQSCGSPWSCPVCAAKISERRRVELLNAMDQHKANGGACVLLTLTNPHTLTDDLGDMVKAQAKAMGRMTGARAFRALLESIGCLGTVRAWEVTHGANGWHPHYHVLLFVRIGLDLDALRPLFYAQWANACRLAGLAIPSEAHGVRLDGGDEASKYVTKGLWGLDHEMTKGHTKKATKGRSPFDLLRSYLYDEDKQAAALFVQYAGVFKGKRQLYWSPGLKALFAVDDLSDEETAALIEDSADLLGMIELEEWRVVLRFDVRGEVLELARHGWEPVRFMLDDLIQRSKDNPIKRSKDQNIERSKDTGLLHAT